LTPACARSAILLIEFELGVGQLKPLIAVPPLAQLKTWSIVVPDGAIPVGVKPRPIVNVVMCCQNAGSSVLGGTSFVMVDRSCFQYFIATSASVSLFESLYGAAAGYV